MNNKFYKATEIAEMIGLPFDKIRKDITDMVRKEQIPISLYHKSEENLKKDRNSYYFKKESIPYIKNYLFIKNILGNPSKAHKVLTEKLNKKELDEIFSSSKNLIKRKYNIYKLANYNLDSIIETILDQNNDFTITEIENNNKLLSLDVLEEVEEKIEKDESKLIGIINLQIDFGELDKALKNVNKIIEKNPNYYEAYVIKGRIYAKFAIDSSTLIRQYQLNQSMIETSGTWHDFEDMIFDEYENLLKQKNSQIELAFSAYKLFEQGNKYPEKETEEIENIIIKYVRTLLFDEDVSLLNYNNTYNKIIYLQEYFQKNKNIENKSSQYSKYPKDQLDIINKIMNKFYENHINFKDSISLIKAIEKLNFLFHTNMEKYIEYSSSFFEQIKNKNINELIPTILLVFFKKDDKKHNKILQQHLNIHFTKEEQEKIMKRLIKLNVDYTIMANEELYIDGYISWNKDNENPDYIDKYKESLSNLTKYSNRYTPYLYGLVKYILKKINELQNDNKHSSSIILLNKLIDYEREIKNLTDYDGTWKTDFYTVEGAHVYEYYDIDGDYIGGILAKDNSYKKSLKEVVFENFLCKYDNFNHEEKNIIDKFIKIFNIEIGGD